MLVLILGQDYSGSSQLLNFLLGKGFVQKTVGRGADFNDMNDALSYITVNWTRHFVIENAQNHQDWQSLLKRPFVLVVAVEAPLLLRYQFWKQETEETALLLEFIQEHDRQVYDGCSAFQDTPLIQLLSHAHVRILNKSSQLDAMNRVFETIQFTNEEWLRPGWDSYFMELCHLASLRSNCMKRRVGCLIVKNNRVVSTGYNGTARRLKNCNEGGCHRCNSGETCGSGLDMCLCIHAEENALLEAGRERVQGGDGCRSLLYATTCPCLGCAKKIIQIGIQEVVYQESYGMDERTSNLFKEAGVLLRHVARSPKWFIINGDVEALELDLSKKKLL